MKTRMEQLINGRFEYEVPGLDLSASHISFSTMPEEKVRGELQFAAKDGRKIKGMAYSTHRRFLLGKEKFSGEKMILPYGVDTKGLDSTDCIEGEIVLSTSIGTYRVPFSVGIKKLEVRTSQGTVGTLEEFVSLAKEDFREAYQLFIDTSFKRLLKGREELLPYYASMVKTPVPYQNLEEFLIGAGLKEPVHLSLEKENLELYEVQTSLKDTLRIRRSGWGFLRAEIQTEGDFLEVEKKVIQDGHFIGSVYDLEYIIRKECLGKGKNFGRIQIKTVYETITYQIMASKNGHIQVNVTAYEKKKRLEAARDFLLLELGRKNTEAWCAEMKALLDELKENGYYSTECQLFEAYVQVRADRKEEARRLLDSLENNQKIQQEEILEGAFLYLNEISERSTQSKEAAAVRLHQLYQRRVDSLLLLSMIFELDEENLRTQSRKMFFLEEQYRIGCRSPFLYLTACRLAAADGSAFRKMNAFTIQVYLFAKKYGILTEEMAFRAIDLAGQMKGFSQKVYEVLQYVYEKYPSVHAVRGICQLIMKGEPRKPEYFRWYELAVQAELKITGLYEYYIETMSRNYQKVLPKVIRLYFGYNNTLSDTKKAFVYSNVIRNKEIDRETYQSYQKNMETFAKEKIKEGRINEDFAVVYQEFCVDSQDENVRTALAKVLFTYRLYCDDPKIRKVIVRHASMKEEQVYLCTDKTTYISLYTKDAAVLFEDSSQRRYVNTVDYNVHNLLDLEELAGKLRKDGKKYPGMLLHTCGELKHESPVTEANVASFEAVLKQEIFCEDYRQNIRKKLLLYYESQMDNRNLRESLREMDFRAFARVNKRLLITILVKQEMFVGAYDLICEYGYEQIEMPVLLRLCSQMILKLEFEYEEELLLLAEYIVHAGIYDEVLLQYLVQHFEGPVEEMVQLWNRAMGFALDCYQLEEKILVCSMFSRVCHEKGLAVLENYISQSGKEQVILSYLTFECYEYFLGEKEKDQFLFEALEKVMERKWECDIICRISLLKHYGETGVWDEKRKNIAEEILEECEKERLQFAFFRMLPRELLCTCQMEDKMFVECRAGRRARVTLHSYIERGETSEEKSEPLKERYQGIYNREFVLFYGEKLHYYFVIEKDGKVETTGEEILTVEESSMQGGSKYQMLNTMLQLREKGKKEELQRMAEAYMEREQQVKDLFALLD